MGDGDDYKSLREGLLDSGKLYEDDTFPATESSLGFGDDVFQWMRPQEICALIDPPLTPEFIVDGRNRADVRQGKCIDDCWVVAAAACFSTVKQETFDRVVPPAQGFSPGEYCGAFQFNFWYFGEWVNVIVDDRLPTKDGKLAFVYSQSPNEFWGALLEKAYAKLNGCYKHLEDGHAADALADFTGGVVEQYVLEINDDSCYERVCSSLKKALNSNSMASLSTSDGGEPKRELENGLVTNHSYSVIGVQDIDLVENTMTACQLVNPWGEGTIWKGDCVDGDSSEKDKVISDLNSGASGEFWIDVNDVIHNFHRLELCFVIDNPSWNYQSEFGSWIPGENAGGDNQCVSFETNPQLIVEFKASEAADTPAFLIVELTQVDRRKEGLPNLFISTDAYDISTADTPLTAEFIHETPPLESSSEQGTAATNDRCIVRRFELSSDCTLAFIFSTHQPDEQGKFMTRLVSNSKYTIRNTHNFGASWKQA